MSYVLVETGVVVIDPAPLPQSWKNISNLPLLSDPDLLVLGWYPANIITTPVNGWERVNGYTYVINATDVDATETVETYLTLEQYKDRGDSQADAELERRQELAEANPSVGTNLNDKNRQRENKKRDNKAKKKNNGITDADDHLYDHIDLLADNHELFIDDIEGAVDYAAVDVIVGTIPNDANWPVWVPE